MNFDNFKKLDKTNIDMYQNIKFSQTWGCTSEVILILMIKQEMIFSWKLNSNVNR